MRGIPLLALVAALSAVARGDDVSRRETVEQVAPLLRRLQPRLRPLASGGRARVYVIVTELTAARRAALEAAGLAIELPAPGRRGLAWPGGELVQGLAPDTGRDALARLPFVVRVEVPGERRTNVGTVTTAGDAILGSANARMALGVDGAGVTVGVISDGADDRAASVASGDLPADVALPDIPGLGKGTGDEGTALLELVHDVAPGAHLLLAAPRTSAEMVLAIDGLAAAGANVIVDDLIFTDEPKFQDGPIALAARRFATSGGVYVAAAGNYARSHYFGTYRPRGSASLAGVQYRALHGFTGDDVGNSLTIPPGADVLVVLQWNNPLDAAQDDFDLILARRASGGDVVLDFSADHRPGASPMEAVFYTNSGTEPLHAYLSIAEYHRVSSPGSLRLDVRIFSSFAVAQEYVVERESIFGHAAVEEVLSVAALPATRSDVLEDFSSRGPASIFFPVPETRRVPRLAAVDRVETAVGRRGVFSNPFGGTSAAAPHVAGCAALLLGAGVQVADVAPAMLTTAVDLSPTGIDTASGAGRLDCLTAGLFATGRIHPPSITAISARFDASGAVVIDASGADPDGDAQTMTIRVLDARGTELADDTRPLDDGSAFAAAATFRSPVLARARAVAVQAGDATRLTSVEGNAVLSCPDDASLGDTLCRVGDLLDRVSESDSSRRLVRVATAATKALSRAGAASAAGRTGKMRRALRVASVRLGRIVRLARRGAVVPELRDAVIDTASTLRARVRILRAG